MKQGKRLKAAREKCDSTKFYPIDEAVKVLKQTASAKFDETVDIVINLGVDPRHADQMVRGVCELPSGSGRITRVAVFATGDKADEAKEAGADIVGAEDLVAEIEAGKIEFDRCIATPDMMPLVGRLGKVLGPRNLMPNPKTGTVTPDVATAVRSAKDGAVEFRVETEGIIHAGIGKTSFTENQLADNVRSFVGIVQKARPSGVKGVYFRSVSLSATMGPSIKIETSNMVPQAPRA